MGASTSEAPRGRGARGALLCLALCGIGCARAAEAPGGEQASPAAAPPAPAAPAAPAPTAAPAAPAPTAAPAAPAAPAHAPPGGEAPAAAPPWCEAMLRPFDAAAGTLADPEGDAPTGASDLLSVSAHVRSGTLVVEGTLAAPPRAGTSYLVACNAHLGVGVSEEHFKALPPHLFEFSLGVTPGAPAWRHWWAEGRTEPAPAGVRAGLEGRVVIEIPLSLLGTERLERPEDGVLFALYAVDGASGGADWSPFWGLFASRDGIAPRPWEHVGCPPRYGPVPEAIPSLRFPARGAWMVIAGNNGPVSHRTRSTRYAFDFVGVDGAGQSVRSEPPQAAEDWFGFGREIIAPCSGKVLGVHDGEPDSPPGSLAPWRDREAAGGNTIWLEAASGLVLFFAHLQEGSIRVAAGDAVREGDRLARCGNSGYSGLAHLHFQAMRREGEAWVGVPVAFRGYVQRTGAREVKVRRGLPVTMDVIAPGE